MDSSDSVQVSLKWGKMMFNNIRISLPGNLNLIQAQIYSLTGVPPNRQKLLFRGSQIKNLEKTPLTEGMLIYLIGSGIVENSIISEEYSEDKKKNVLAEPYVDVLPIILLNLGNTCYLNATLQLLRCIPELRAILKEYAQSKGGAEDKMSLSMSASLRDLFKHLDQAPIDEIVSPVKLFHVLQLVAPNFGERDKNGSLRQQDANECLSVIVRMLQSELPPYGDSKKHPSFIDQYLTGQFEVTSKCIETNDCSTILEEFLQLTCFISQEVKYLSSGIRLSLQEEINKYSEELKRDAMYKRAYRINRLPAYLIVNFLRFYYKEKVNTNAKILREVKFPIEFDAYEFCTDSLKRKIESMRENFKLEEDYCTKSGCDSRKFKCDKYPFSFEDDTGSNNSGYYQLQAVITHKGRTSQAGHYIAWVKIQESDRHLWAKVDDDVRYSDITEEDILRLAGGSDNHTAYLLLYGPKILGKSQQYGI